MILYLDTSALVKAYISEINSHEVITSIKHATIVASNSIAYVEACATFSRLKREKKLTEKEYEMVKEVFSKDWENFLHVESTKTLIKHAADLAEAFSLRAYDSIHLAAANLISREAKQAVKFACFDRQLNKAAEVLGLLVGI